MTNAPILPSAAMPIAPSMASIYAAQARLAPYLQPTPLLRLRGAPFDLPDRRIFLKLENLQTTGAFKVRPALNALLSRSADSLRAGVATASSGNMAYGLAWAANRLGVPMAAYMVAGAPAMKVAGVQGLGGDVRFISEETWWRYIIETERPAGPELLISPVTDAAVLAGNGTIGLEIVQALPDVDVVLTPYGGGGMTVGVASAVKALQPKVRVLAVEGAHAAPVTAALRAGAVVPVACEASFIRSIGGPTVVPGIWPLARTLLDGSCVVDLAQVVQAMGWLASYAKVVAEGAGAAALAAAVSDPTLRGNIVCVVSGGNIDMTDYVQALQGRVPAPS